MAPTFYDDDAPIRIEIRLPAAPDASDDPTRDLRDLIGGVRERVTTVSDEALFTGFKSIYKLARKTQVLIADLSAQDTAHQLTEAEVVFGLSFSAGGTPFITVGTEATLSITLKWQQTGDPVS